MAAKKDPNKFYDWPDGKGHSISYAQHLINERAKAGNPLTLPDPPKGTYDPAIDYNADASQRGYDQLFNDAQTRFEHGQQDYGLNLGDLTRSRDWSLADLGTSKTRLGEDYQHQTNLLGRQYGILGNRQAEGAAQRGVTSAGLLGKSAQTRANNQALDQFSLDRSRNRGLEDIGTQTSRTNTMFDQGKLRLDLGNAREFGGFNGANMINPLTGQPEFGSLLTGVTRAGAENTSFQAAMSGQRAQQAAAGGYVSPLLSPVAGGSISIGNTPLTGQMHQQGVLLEALVRGSAKQQGKSVEEVARGLGIDPNTWRPL